MCSQRRAGAYKVNALMFQDSMAKATSQEEGFPCQEQSKDRCHPVCYPPLSLRSWIRRCLVTKSCLTLCDPGDCSLPGSSVHGIFQARTLQWGFILG